MEPNESVRARVVRHLLEASDAKLTADAVTDATTLQQDLALGSLQAVSLMLDLEDEFHITLETDELDAMKTVGDLLRTIETKLATPSI